jgi:hypothetical protein
MRNNNEEIQNHNESLNNFIPNLLIGLKHQEPKRLDDVFNFFKSQFLNLTDHDLFENPDYRREWQLNISLLENLTTLFNGFTSEEINSALTFALMSIEASRKEACNG